MRVLTCLFAGLMSCLGPRADAARLVPLGWLPGGNVNEAFSTALDVSADGTVVVGSSRYLEDGDFRDTAFRWTEAEGMTRLGIGFEGAYPEEASAVSGDGQRIFGTYAEGDGPFRWTASGGIDSISPQHTRPSDASYDGSVVVGSRTSGGGCCSPRRVSENGQVIAGQEFSEAFREVGGVRTWLGDFPGGDFQSQVAGVSGDGFVIAGTGSTAVDVDGTPTQTSWAFRWTESQGLVRIGDWFNESARDMSASKLVIVGAGKQLPSMQRAEAFRWTPAKGNEYIDDLLMAEGIDWRAMGGDELTINRVSADGRVMVGYISTGSGPGRGSEAILIELDVPGDFDQDGDSDGSDFLAWQQSYGTTYDAADLADWNANLDYLRDLLAPASTANSVPELPASGLAGAAVVALACFSIRRRETGV